MSITKDMVQQAFRALPAPGGGDFVSAGLLQWTAACEAFASAKVHLPGQAPAALEPVARAAHERLLALAAAKSIPVASFIVEFVDQNGTVVHTSRFAAQEGAAQTGAAAPAPAQAAPPPPRQESPGHEPIAGLGREGRSDLLPNVRHIIAVGAGKGGVGKSAVALNLAVGLARRGHSVGLLDGDIYGPSMPTMLGLASLEPVVHGGMLQPFYVHGIKCMTIGRLVDPERPLIWRGPMAHGAFKQLVEQTEWGELDYMIIDLPPGTGDISLTMAQLLPLTGAVVVCTPQKVAQDDAVRAIAMFRQLKVPLLGVVENMSHFVGDDGKVYDIFGKGGAEVMAQRTGVPFLGAIPLTMPLRIHSDRGDPTANFTGKDGPGKALAASLEAVVTNTESQVAIAAMRTGAARPALRIS